MAVSMSYDRFHILKLQIYSGCLVMVSMTRWESGMFTIRSLLGDLNGPILVYQLRTVFDPRLDRFGFAWDSSVLLISVFEAIWSCLTSSVGAVIT